MPPTSTASVVGIKDLWLAVAQQRFLQRPDEARRFHRDRHPPRQHGVRGPIEHDPGIDEALGHENARDIHRPDLRNGGQIASGAGWCGIRTFQLNRASARPSNNCEMN